MRLFIVSCFWIAALSVASAQVPPSSTPMPPGSATSMESAKPLDRSLREAALDNLLSERNSPKAFETAINDARRNGVSEQAILEARFLFHVDRDEDEAIAALAAEFVARRDSFKLEDTAIFGEKEDWLAVVEYVQAIDALRKGDKDAFKRHITEAFWLSPGQASAFAPHIDRMRLDDAMRSVKVDFDAKFSALQNGETVTLKDTLNGKKALLLHFWSPLSPECEAAMPDFVATASALADKDISVISLIPENDPRQVEEARKMVAPLATKTSGTWVVDAVENPLGRMMRVRNLPTVVLLSAQGKVLFNGYPTDEKFWESMMQVDPKVARPKSGID